MNIHFKFGIPAGPTGKDGASTYDTWLAEGNSGTEQDFLDAQAALALQSLTFSGEGVTLPSGSEVTVDIVQTTS